MLHTTVIPRESRVYIEIPNEYIGKKVEVLLFTEDKSTSVSRVIKEKTLSSKEKKAFKALNEVWGNDEDGIYEKHYQRLVKEKSHDL